MLRVFPLLLVVFVGYFSFSLTIPIFSILALKEPHGALKLAFIFAMYPLGQFFGAPFLGSISDRYGRKMVITTSLLLSVIFYCFIAIAAESMHLYILLPALFLAGASESNVVIAQSAIADITTPENRSHFFGYVTAAASSAYIFGPVFGAYLAHLTTPGIPFFTSALIILFTLLLIAFTFKETHPKDKRRHVHLLQAFTNIQNVFRLKKLRPLYLASFLYSLSFFGFVRYFPHFLIERYNWNMLQVGEYATYLSIPLFIVNLFFIKPVVTRFNRQKIVFISLFTATIFILTFGSIPTIQNIWISGGLIMAAMAFSGATITGLISQRADADRQGDALGNNTSLRVGAQALIAFIVNYLGGFWLFLPLLLIALISLSALLAISRAKHP